MARSLRNTNANLLVALDALLTEQNVTRAARRLGITQSSMSANLAQLRRLFDDPLLVRAGRSMRPTPLAQRITTDLRLGIDALEAVLAGGPHFEPTTSEERFVLALNDRVESVLFPALATRVFDLAPHVTLQVVPWGRIPPPPGLGTGEIDVGVSISVSDPPAGLGRGAPPDLPSGYHSRALFDSGLASMVRADHPKASSAGSLETFCALDHILVTDGLGEIGVVDHMLAARGCSRRIALRVPRLTLVGELVAQTDLVATMDRRVAARQAHRHGLHLFPPPVELPQGEVILVWHERTHAAPARRWLREQIFATARLVDTPA